MAVAQIDEVLDLIGKYIFYINLISQRFRP